MEDIILSFFRPYNILENEDERAVRRVSYCVTPSVIYRSKKRASG
jgi:hypothetical protein